ncbi:hypothetical protein IC235_17490 [Hymenobacter sp. BT664]|uniref:STAS/SEC14 domain-containing protein n=1 Tax=Hymenobacter montanus TaxID=2771359 RepID=A0A927BF20_9BACT|nr:hypothetical protein [Hymenobacter montanus]MBD2769686.1 hypothetical protein [Hymenobacter montanus]
MPSITLPLFQVTPRPDLGILVGRWGYQPDPSELPAVYAQLAEAGLRDGSRFWLQDIRRRTLNDPYTTQWLLAEYFPNVAAQLGGRLYVAYLVSPDLHHHIVTGPAFEPIASYQDKPFVLAFFGKEGEAMDWLNEQRTADPA